jgi:NAD(P)-dependent dehydrogenase (short-subunit alcohol dehydrogenase family)
MAAGKVALITGASRGIGQATALALARGGYRLAQAARGPSAPLHRREAAVPQLDRLLCLQIRRLRPYPGPGGRSAPRGIRVTALLPGSVDTPFWDEAGGRLDRAQMLRPEAVGETIRAILDQPEGMNTDEVVLMPPFGVL